MKKIIGANRWLLASPAKVPHYTNGARRSGKLDTPADVAQFASYNEARAALQRYGRNWNLGFALGPDGEGGYWQGVDFDKIVDNSLTEAVDLLPGYVEWSPSKKGVHAIGYGRPFRALGSNSSGVEAYSSKRFFTFTGDVIRDGDPTCLADHVEINLAPLHQPASRSGCILAGVTTRYAPEKVSAKAVTELRSALNFMPADSYGRWIELGHALKTLGNVGRGLWMDWSASYEKFESLEATRKWESFAPDKTSYQAVFAKAQMLGWTNPASNAAQMGTSLDAGGESRKNGVLIVRSLDGVGMRAIDWLWVGLIPKGYITLFVGETGAGKSTVLADITARVTVGAAWPGESVNERRVAGRVLWLSSEDSAEEMVVPRLKACGAKLSNVLEIRGVQRDGQRTAFSMQDNLRQVSDWLEFARDEGHPFTMLVIDPVTSYLPGERIKKVDINDAGQLRSILEPWLLLAQNFNIAVVCVTHFAKDTTRSMLNRVLGSGAFSQTCRSLCAVIEPPSRDGQVAVPHAKALVQVKTNLPEHPGGAWNFTTVKVEVGVDERNGKPIYATRPEWGLLDPAFVLQSAIGRSRGPVSKVAFAFGSWMLAHFSRVTHAAGEWSEVSEVRSRAMSEIGISESWWDKHSGDFLEKKNADGKWLCRPKLNDKTSFHSGVTGLIGGNVGDLGGAAFSQSAQYLPLPPSFIVFAEAAEPVITPDF